MSQNNIDATHDNVLVVNAAGSSSVVLICEHASHHIPRSYNDLGLSRDARKSHAVWDPGAMATARLMAEHLDAVLIATRVSRLIYDCNRPPASADAMPARSEIIEVPGNQHLSQPMRDARVDAFYRPFQAALHSLIQRIKNPIIVTIHSFTPTYHGRSRTVEIGVLHDSDTRFADAMLEVAHEHTTTLVRRNEPYGPEHGVTHTLREHGVRGGHLNVMLEIRNDLIETAKQQVSMADTLSGWIADAFAQVSAPGDVQCRG